MDVLWMDRWALYRRESRVAGAQITARPPAMALIYILSEYPVPGIRQQTYNLYLL